MVGCRSAPSRIAMPEALRQVPGEPQRRNNQSLPGIPQEVTDCVHQEE